MKIPTTMPSTEALRLYADQEIFRDADTWEISRRPYQRSLRPQSLSVIDLTTQLNFGQSFDYEALAAQRVLTCVYEQDLVFLPQSPYDGWTKDFDLFYSEDLRKLAGMFRTDLESYCFKYLESHIEVSDRWTREDFVEFFEGECQDLDEYPSWERTIRESKDAERAAKMWLVQFAPDFLSESSPMMKNVLGHFGPTQSEWFKILIDEYGYGVHEKKHSTLYERTLESVGLNPEPHYYWQYYVSSALAANNFFHYLGSEHRNFFRYAGALAYTETTLVDFCHHAVSTLGDVFDSKCDVEYFTEHCHIDDHHGKMAFEKVCLALIDQFGEHIIPDLVWGIRAYQEIVSQFDEQFAMQVAWMDDQPDLFEMHKDIVAQVKADASVPVVDLDEEFNELSNSHCHNQDELCHVESGQMYFFSGLDSKLILNPGDGVVIKNRRQHGADILSDNCQYQIYTIGDYRKWL